MTEDLSAQIILLLPPLIAGILVAFSHVPLGQEVLRRGIVFLDLAVAQIAGLGAVIASVWFGWDGWPGQLAAACCALLAAYGFAALERKGQTFQEACIGCAFVVAASLMVLVFSGDPHGGEEVSNLLAGQVLWVSWPQIGLAAAISIPLGALIWARPEILRQYFYPFFAISVTLSVQVVGVYLVFAMLIMPAMLASSSKCAGLAISVGCFMLGLLASLLADLPTGPAIVCAFAAITSLALLIKKPHRIEGLFKQRSLE